MCVVCLALHVPLRFITMVVGDSGLDVSCWLLYALFVLGLLLFAKGFGSLCAFRAAMVDVRAASVWFGAVGIIVYSLSLVGCYGLGAMCVIEFPCGVAF